MEVATLAKSYHGKGRVDQLGKEWRGWLLPEEIVRKVDNIVRAFPGRLETLGMKAAVPTAKRLPDAPV
ncbi:MAG: hypothetical protein QW506_05925 [Thermoproteota archaeon]